MGDVLYKEITPYPECSDRWKDITINAGASQSTLQDIKLPETAGCFTYRTGGNVIGGTSNRFIYWRTTNDVMEFVEISLDLNLRGNHLRLRFQHSPILQGVSIHETGDRIVILVPTVSTIHKLIFPHPKILQRKDQFLKYLESIYPSIFFDATVSKLRDHSTYFVLNHASVGAPLPHTSCSWLTAAGDATFVLANNAGSHLMVIMEERNGGKITTTELKRTSVMSRLWNGLVRGSQGSDVALSIVCHQDVSDVYIFSLCRDLRIRMWSQNKQECLMIASILEHFGEIVTSFISNNNAQQCWLRKSVSHTSFDYYLGVYISSPQLNQFLIFKPVFVVDHYCLSHITTLCDSKLDLVDFCLSSSYVWALWLNSESEPVVKMMSIESNEKVDPNIGWLSVDLQPSVSSNVFISFEEQDPREAYLKEIFKPGRFSSSTISKVIFIYHKSVNTSFSTSTRSEAGTLREEVVKAVESEIFMRERETELTDVELQELTIECWDKFFSYCIQYHEVGTKPLGLSFDPDTGYVIIIKKNVYSILYPCDSLEQLTLSDVHHVLDAHKVFSSNPVVSDDPALGSSVLVVFQCLSCINSYLSTDMIKTFEDDLFHLSSPNEIGLKVAKELYRLPSDPEGGLLIKLRNHIQMISEIVPALKHLLHFVDVGQKDESYDLEGVIIPGFMDYQHFLSSAVGVSLLCEGFSQFAKHRFTFCRDLLLLELLLMELDKRSPVLRDLSRKIESDLLPSTRLLVQCYYILKWCSECAFANRPTSSLESGLKQLTLLDVSENIAPLKSTTDDTVCRTIVYHFLEAQGRKDTYTMLAIQVPYEEFRQKSWTQFLPQLIKNVATLLWPFGPYFLFPEFLLKKNQCLQLQVYNRLLGKWCAWNSFSRQFFVANCFLLCGEHEKAVNLFIKAAKGVEEEEFLRNKILASQENSMMQDNRGTSSSYSIAQYYMKVIEFFEQLGLSYHIITLATTAIGILKTHANDSHIPIFWSLIFKHHLELGHSEQAYTALKGNPDASRKKDCLRQLVVVMCERKEFDTLVKFSYLHENWDMQDDVISILETRARSSDLLQQSFYDLLYTFHIHRNNFRKAASIMFEYGMRLGQEVNNFEGLQKQAACFLSTINCLSLVDPNYAWIVKPVPKIDNAIDGSESENPGMSPKRDSDGEMIPDLKMPKKIEVLVLSDIKKEYDLIHARLLLVQRDQSDSNLAATPLCAADCIALLVSEGLFDVAVELCTSFSLSLIPVFEGLTYRCVAMMQSTSGWLKNDDNELFEWLGQNDSSNLPGVGYISGKEQAWYLLKHYLEQYEKEGETIFHRCVVSKLLPLGVHLPIWLKHSYQKRNCSELLWLHIKYGMLETATDLAIELIDAALGKAKPGYGLKHSLKATNPAIWLPHSYFDALYEALEDIQNESYCSQLYQQLTQKMDEYLKEVKQVSDNILLTRGSY